MADAWAHQEFAGCQVPDRRFTGALTRIASDLARNAEQSFSEAVGHAGRQAANRLYRNERTEIDGLLAGHYQQSAARCGNEDLVLLIQDTTFLNFSSHKATAGLGPIGISPNLRGLVAHSVLAVSTQGQPLGLQYVDIWARETDAPLSRDTKRSRPTCEKESQKWLSGLKAAQSRLGANQKAICVCDREADMFSFLAEPRRKNIDILVRASHPRSVEVPTDDSSQQTNLLCAAAMAPQVALMRVTVPAKPGRAERVAELTIRATPLIARPPRHGKREQTFKPLNLTVIDARENGEGLTDPIHWVLITTKAAMTAEECCQFVTYYSRRWVIERLHYTLKSGCKVERLQIDDASALKLALSVYFVVAWRLLSLTYIARTDPDRPAEDEFETSQIEVLEAATETPIKTVAAAVLAIAKLGGYVRYKTAPPPGPKTLWLGLRKLDSMVIGWILAHKLKNVNQD